MRNRQSIPVVAHLLSDIMAGLTVAAKVIGRSLTSQAGFEPRSLHVGCMARKVTLGRFFVRVVRFLCQSRWSRGLRHEFVAAGRLVLRFRIPPWAWMSVSYECCVLSVRGL